MSSNVPAGFEPGGRFEEWDRPDVAYVALDMDGTILAADDKVAAQTVTAMLSAVERGVAVGLASGRMRNGAVHIHDVVSVPGPHIFHDGAEVRADGRTVAAFPLDRSDVDAILAIAADLDAYCELYGVEDYHITRNHDGAELHWRSLARDPAGMVADLDLGGIFFKATFIGFSAAETSAIETGAMEAGLDIGTAKATGMDWDFINIKQRGVNKGRGLDAVVDYLGITLDQSMAVGDGRNDIPMLVRAGTAVAMGQASQTVRDASHLVTRTVADFGAAFALDGLANAR